VAHAFLFPSAAGTFLFLAQFIAPVLVLAAGLVAFVKRTRRRRLMDAVVKSGRFEILNEIPSADFALLVAEAFRSRGYKVSEPAGGDLEVRRDGASWPVQRRQWQGILGAGMVREFHSVLSRGGRSSAFMVTSGLFSDEAIAFAHDTAVRLVDGRELYAMLQEAAASR
jgi:restriction system protein